MVLLSLHALGYSLAWVLQGGLEKLGEELTDWMRCGKCNARTPTRNTCGL